MPGLLIARTDHTGRAGCPVRTLCLNATGACRQLRERMLHDREVAVEGERAAAQKRLSDAAERYEASAQQARMHLVADHERRLGEAEDAWRMQRRELMDRVRKLEQSHQELQAETATEVLKAREEERHIHNNAVKV